MKELEEIFKNIGRIADAMEKRNNLLEKLIPQEIEVQNNNILNTKVINGAPNVVNMPKVNNEIQPTNIINAEQQVSNASIPTTIPVSTSMSTYTQDDLARAMGRALDMGKMTEVQNVISSFGVSSLMELNQDYYPILVQKLKEIGVEV